VQQLPEQQPGRATANDGDLSAMHLHTFLKPYYSQYTFRPVPFRPAAKSRKQRPPARDCVKEAAGGMCCQVPCKKLG